MLDNEDIKPRYLLPGTKIGFYEVVTLAGSGGFGALYKVTRDGEVLALKLCAYNLSALTEEERLQHEERADREVVALKSLRHPNIVKVHAFERWPNRQGYPYIVMDFVEGHRLYDWRAKLTPSLRRIVEVFRKIALALEEMHRIEVYHRDLKSENVLVRADGEPIIVDFGISRPRSAYTLTQAGKMMGTYAYFTPEYCRFQRSGEYARGERFPYRATADLHCIGYMLYHCVTGRPPFLSDAESEQIDLIEEIEFSVPPEPHVVNPNVPGRLSSVVMKLLEKEPAKRYQSGKELAEALGEALDLADASWDSPLDVPPRRGPEDSTRESGQGRASLKGAAPAVGSGLEDTVVRPEQPAQEKSGGQGVRGEPRFSPPTPGGHGSKREQTSGGVPNSETRLPSAIREAGDRIEAARASAARAKLRPLVAVGAMAALVVILLGLMFIGSRQPRDARSPQSLLTEAERRAAQSRMAAPDMAVAQGSMLSTAIPSSSAQRDESAPGAEKQAVRNRDAAEIDSLLAKSYGRPKVSPGTKDDAALPPPGPSWLYRGRRVDSASKTVAAAGPKRYGVPLGAKLRARLLSNLDSRTISGGPVEAMLMRPYIQGGVVVFPSRTMVYGRASTNTGRFAVELTRLRLPDMTEVPFQGLAIDPGDGKPGLLATGRISGASPGGSNIVAAVARGVASAALGKVQGDDGVDLARGAGQTVLNATGQSAVGGGTAETLLLDRGMDFDVFVSEAF